MVGDWHLPTTEDQGQAADQCPPGERRDSGAPGRAAGVVEAHPNPRRLAGTVIPPGLIATPVLGSRVVARGHAGPVEAGRRLVAARLCENPVGAGRSGVLVETEAAVRTGLAAAVHAGGPDRVGPADQPEGSAVAGAMDPVVAALDGRVVDTGIVTQPVAVGAAIVGGQEA